MSKKSTKKKQEEIVQVAVEQPVVEQQVAPAAEEVVEVAEPTVKWFIAEAAAKRNKQKENA